MKRIIVFLLPYFIVTNLLACDTSTNDTFAGDTTNVVMPAKNEAKIGMLVTEILNKHHYRKVPLNDSLSSVIYDNYIKALDNNKLYFTSSDINNFEQYRYTFDEDLKNGNLVPTYFIFNIFKRKFQERSAFINQLLEKEFDFSKEESFQTNRDKLQWAKTEDELNDAWRKTVKNQALSLKLSGKEWEETSKIIRDRYKNLGKSVNQFTSEEVLQLFLNSFAAAVDPHTSYFSPASAEDFKTGMSLSLEGIGAQLQSEGDYTKVADIIAGGPAFKSSLLHKNDKIIGVAQGKQGEIVDVVGWRLPEVVKLIRGPKNTTVRLQILAAEGGADALPIEISLVRDKIKLEEAAAKKKVINIKQNNKDYKLGVISIPTFYMDFEGAQKGEKDYKSTTRDVRRILEELKAENVDGVLVDLSYNGGGSLSEAIDLTGLFIPSGPVVQIRNSSGAIDVGKDQDPGVVYGGPLAVITNRFSASASEIFAGAIQDYKRGVIIGEQTYGKGTVQNLIDLDRFFSDDNLRNNRTATAATFGGPGQLKLTIAKFYRITGSSTQHKGVTPDIELPSAFSAEQFGESSQPGALPWDMIAPTSFKPIGAINDKIIANLKQQYQQRLKTAPELKQFVEDVEEIKKSQQDSLVSLHYDTRKKAREDAEKKSSTRIKLSGGIESLDEAEAANNTEKPAEDPKKIDDPYLRESLKILANLIK
ncbi:MAG: carboxy terminal-processing peptidase [Bacteroidota bacterium]|nr:carboxy terminal-processing peptidase [Bacteroidota bacterium]